MIKVSYAYNMKQKQYEFLVVYPEKHQYNAMCIPEERLTKDPELVMRSFAKALENAYNHEVN